LEKFDVVRLENYYCLEYLMMMMMFSWTNYKRGVLKSLSSANVKRRTANKAQVKKNNHTNEKKLQI
jgi:hypothetical protein